MASIPLYTLRRTLTQQAVIERDMSTPDQFGADTTPDFQPYLTSPCRLWWAKGNSATRSANRTYVNVTREVSISTGGMLLAPDVDITESDRITQINRWDPIALEWVLMIDGVFQIIAVLNQEETHTEVEVLRAHTGA